MSLDLERAAEILANVRLGRTPLDTLPENCRPETPAQGYSIEALLRMHLEERGLGAHVGYKIGCTTPVMQKFLNINQPCCGGIMENTVYQHPVDLKLDNFQHVGVECEIAVRMAEDVVIDPDTTAPADTVGKAVGSCMAALEIVDNRYVDYTTTSTPTLIADGFFGAGCVLGEEITPWEDLDLENTAGRMLVDGEVVGEGMGSAILGHPLNALCWLANHLAQSGQTLKVGQLVLLGSVVQTRWIDRPETIVVEVGGLGRVEATFN